MCGTFWVFAEEELARLCRKNLIGKGCPLASAPWATIIEFHAQDLTALDQGSDWRCPPAKVRAPDGRVFSFKACERTPKNMTDDTAAMVNTSIDTINACSLVSTRRHRTTYISPGMEGIAVTQPSVAINDSRPSATSEASESATPRRDPYRRHPARSHQQSETPSGAPATRKS